MGCRPRRPPAWLGLLLLLSRAAVAADPPTGLRVEAGFVVSEYAGPELANDIIRMTVHPDGRLVVAGLGYIRILADDDRDGRADRAIPFADVPADGAMGLLWEEDALYYVGDGGLRRLRDADRDDRPDGPPELIRPVKTGGEHDAHQIRRGPDGWLYLLGGNFTGIDRSWASLPTSPITDPVAGCLVRFAPDLSGSEVVADGFRNAYDFDFTLDGEVVTYDSDNERCVSLPWYEPTRVYHVIPGGRHGWLAPQLAETWRLPPYLPDVVPPIATLGRGSPTGVVCYRHTRFPPEYHGGFFVLDWTFGRVWFLRLSPSGATYTTRARAFLQAVGEDGFAPTDAVVHPDSGELFISIGGRGTRGSVYRITPTGPSNPSEATPVPLTLGRRSLDDAPDWERRALSGPDRGRLEALVNLRRHRDRHASAALAGAIRANWERSDRAVRMAAAALAGSIDGPDRDALARDARSPLSRTTLALGLVDSEPERAVDLIAPVLEDVEATDDARLAAVRVCQLAVGGVGSDRDRGTAWEGYVPRRPDHVERMTASPAYRTLRSAAPRGCPRPLDREITRTLALTGDESPQVLDAIARRLDESSDPLDDLHDLIVISRLRAPRTPEVTRRVASGLIMLPRKLDRRGARRDRNWDLRVTELLGRLAERDPGLGEALVSDDRFGDPGHAILARIPGLDRPRAAERILDRGGDDPDYPWDEELVALLAEGPAERSLPVLRRLWGRPRLESAIAPLLARDPEPGDRPKFVASLELVPTERVGEVLSALEALPCGDDPEEVVALVRLLGRLGDVESGSATRERVAMLLRRQSGIDSDSTRAGIWAELLADRNPALAERLRNPDGLDLSAWSARRDRIAWDSGDAGRGREVFRAASCAACHAGGTAVGPDLRGVTGRFGRQDLLTAILQPSRDVADRYRSLVVATRDGQVHRGVVIYEAADGLILQTGPASTVRIAAEAVAERRASATSLMPAGLLDPLDDAQVADLFAYLRSLGRGDALPEAADASKTLP